MKEHTHAVKVKGRGKKVMHDCLVLPCNAVNSNLILIFYRCSHFLTTLLMSSALTSFIWIGKATLQAQTHPNPQCDFVKNFLLNLTHNKRHFPIYHSLKFWRKN